jgi:hypothetical protein
VLDKNTIEGASLNKLRIQCNKSVGDYLGCVNLWQLDTDLSFWRFGAVFVGFMVDRGQWDRVFLE